MLFYSVFQTFHRKKNDGSVVLKSLNPEGPVGSCLCEVTLPALDHMSVSFLWNKENKQDFLLPVGEKNKIFLSFLWSVFLVPVFFCSLIIPFMEDVTIFI